MKFEGNKEDFLTLSDTLPNLNPPAAENDASIVLESPPDVEFELETYSGVLSFEIEGESLMNIEFDVVITEPDCDDLVMDPVAEPEVMEITLGSTQTKT